MKLLEIFSKEKIIMFAIIVIIYYCCKDPRFVLRKEKQIQVCKEDTELTLFVYD